VQSRRSAEYESALDRLKAMDLVYPCYCTRADIAAALAAPHAPAAVYPGTCKGLAHDFERPHSWRLDAAKALEMTDAPSWSEVDGRTFSSSDIGDEILARKDAPAAYHLACVVDDAASGVTLVTRGADLRASTPVQRLLQMVLGLPEPTYFHHPLVTHEDGRRLAKRDQAPTLAAMREAGVDGRALARQLAAGSLPGGFRFAGA